MKKLSSLIIALFVLSAGTVFGQATATIEAQAEIVTSIEVQNVNNVDFGLLSGDVNAYLNTGVTSESATTGIISGQSLGSFDLVGGADVTLTWGTATLAKTDDATETMTFAPFLSYDDGGTQTEITDGTTEITLSGTATTVTVGGELQGVNGKPSGIYNTTTAGGSDLEVTITYTTI
jgi:hypothetical protein